MSKIEWTDSSALSDAANVYHNAARVELHSASSNSRIQTIDLKLDEFLVLADSARDIVVRVEAMWEQVFTRTKIVLLRKVSHSAANFKIAREFPKPTWRFSKFFSPANVTRVRLPYHVECELIGSNEFIRLDCDSHRFVKSLRALPWLEFRVAATRPGDRFFRSGNECEVFDSTTGALSVGPLALCAERAVFDRLVALGSSAPSSPLTATATTTNSATVFHNTAAATTASQQASATDVFASPAEAAAAAAPVVLDFDPDFEDYVYHPDAHHDNDDDDADFVNTRRIASTSSSSSDDLQVTGIRTVPPSSSSSKPPALSWIDSAEQGVTPTREVVRGPRLVRLGGGGSKKARVVNSDDGRAAVFGNLLYAQKRAAQLPTAGAAAPIEIGDDSSGGGSDADADDAHDAHSSSPGAAPGDVQSLSSRKRQSRLDAFLPGHARRAAELKQRQREFAEQARKERVAAQHSSLQLNFEMLRRQDAAADSQRVGAATPAAAANNPPLQLVPLYTDGEAFGIYVQYVASCEVDDEFASAIRESDELDGSYFFPALRKIEQGLCDVQQGFVNSAAWTDDLRRSLDNFARFALSKAPSSTGRCQACNRSSAHDRGYELVLGGMHYDAQRLWSHTELLRYDDAPARVYEIGPSCGARTKLYHTMQHWKYNFMLAMQSHLVDKRAQLQLDGRRDLTPEESRRLIDAVCDDRRWNAAQHARYTALLDEGRNARHTAPDDD